MKHRFSASPWICGLGQIPGILTPEPAFLRRNWLEVFPYESWYNSTIPVFVQGQGFVPSELRMTSGATSPPSRLKEHDLIQLMDRHGVGTDATIAQHITTVQERNYAVKHPQTKDFAPTDLGRALVMGYEAIGLELARPHFRAR